MKSKILGAAAVLTALAAGPAAAMTLTFTGTVTGDYEFNAFGVAGPASNSFYGDAYTAVYNINPGNGAVSTAPPGPL